MQEAQSTGASPRRTRSTFVPAWVLTVTLTSWPGRRRPIAFDSAAVRSGAARRPPPRRRGRLPTEHETRHVRVLPDLARHRRDGARRDRDDGVSDRRRCRARELHRRQAAHARHAKDSDVEGRVRPDDDGDVDAVAGDRHLDRVRRSHHVVVRHDRAVGRDDHPGPCRCSPAFEGVENRVDVDDGRIDRGSDRSGAGRRSRRASRQPRRGPGARAACHGRRCVERRPGTSDGPGRSGLTEHAGTAPPALVSDADRGRRCVIGLWFVGRLESTYPL